MKRTLDITKDDDTLQIGRAYLAACLKIYEQRTKPSNIAYAFNLEKARIGPGSLGDSFFKGEYGQRLINILKQLSVKGLATPIEKSREKPLYACARVLVDNEKTYTHLGDKVKDLALRNPNDPDKIWRALLEED